MFTTPSGASGETIHKPSENNRKPLSYFERVVTQTYINQIKVNDVNGNSDKSISSIRVFHESQLMLDCHRETAGKTNSDLQYAM